MNRITRYEWQILSLFLLSIIVNVSYFHMHIVTFIVFYLFGILFEFITEPLWDYNPELHQSPFTLRSKDINFLFGLGWCAIVILSLSIGVLLTTWIPSALLCAVIGFLVIGNILETLYLYFGLWTYNTSHPMLRFPPVLGRYIEVFTVPLSVRLGYAVNGIVAYYLNVLVTRILSGTL